MRKTPGPQSSCLGPQDLTAGRVLFSNTRFYSQRPLQGGLKFVGLEGAGRAWTVSSATFNLLIGLGQPGWLLRSVFLVSGLLEKRGWGERGQMLFRKVWLGRGGRSGAEGLHSQPDQGQSSSLKRSFPLLLQHEETLHHPFPVSLGSSIPRLSGAGISLIG